MQALLELDYELTISAIKKKLILDLKPRRKKALLYWLPNEQILDQDTEHLGWLIWYMNNHWILTTSPERHGRLSGDYPTVWEYYPHVRVFDPFDHTGALDEELITNQLIKLNVGWNDVDFHQRRFAQKRKTNEFLNTPQKKQPPSEPRG